MIVSLIEAKGRFIYSNGKRSGAVFVRKPHGQPTGAHHKNLFGPTSSIDKNLRVWKASGIVSAALVGVAEVSGRSVWARTPSILQEPSQLSKCTF